MKLVRQPVRRGSNEEMFVMVSNNGIELGFRFPYMPYKDVSQSEQNAKFWEHSVPLMVG